MVPSHRPIMCYDLVPIEEVIVALTMEFVTEGAKPMSQPKILVIQTAFLGTSHSFSIPLLKNIKRIYPGSWVVFIVSTRFRENWWTWKSLIILRSEKDPASYKEILQVLHVLNLKNLLSTSPLRSALLTWKLACGWKIGFKVGGIFIFTVVSL